MMNEQNTALKIRAKYQEKQITDLDTLRELDKKVTRPANAFAYTFGSISALIMGAGMSLVMTDIAQKLNLPFDSMIVGIGIGIVGMILALINYPIYKVILNSRRKKFESLILELSKKIIEQ